MTTGAKLVDCYPQVRLVRFRSLLGIGETHMLSRNSKLMSILVVLSIAFVIGWTMPPDTEVATADVLKQKPTTPTQLKRQHEVELAELQLDLRKQAVVIAKAERELLVPAMENSRAQVAATEKQLAVARKQLDILKANFAQGSGTQIEIAQTEAQLYVAESSLVAAESVAEKHRLSVNVADAKIRRLEIKVQIAQKKLEYQKKLAGLSAK